MPIGAQMFTLRDHCSTIDDIARSLEHVAAMGYDGIQASAGGFGTTDPDEVKQIKKALDDNGLVCGATHDGLRNLDDDGIRKLIEKLNILDCNLTALGAFNSGADNWTAAAWSDFAKYYNDIAAKFAEAGIRIGYHNHSHELAPLDDGRLPLQLLLDELDESIWFEIDVYWIAHGLADPAQWVEKVAGRIPAIHYKDGLVDPERNHVMVSVGAGNLNWSRINDAARNAGVQWYLVERDSGPEDPFEALETSVKNIKAWGIQ